MLRDEIILSKIRRLPASIAQEVEDFVDFLLERNSAKAISNESKTHPLLAAYGSWADDPSLENLTAEIYANRLRPSTRVSVSL